jgi:hypothetical protein
MSDRERHSRRLRPGWATLAVLLVIVGAGVLVTALRAQRHAPQPPPSAASPIGQRSATSSPTSSAGPRRSSASRGPLLAASLPVGLSIPSIGVQSNLLKLGLNADRSVQVPPLSRDSQAGWYQYSPTPGQLGPSVILGHVDSAEFGPGIFFRLGAMRPGDSITVTRVDHTAAVFRVDRVVSYPKDHFPTLEVYGNTDHAALRLITCGGRFDFSTHNYLSNIVVYASLVSSHPA